MREQLKVLSVQQMIMVQEMAHVQTSDVFTRLGFVDIRVNSDKYVCQYNTEMITLIMGRDICWANEEENSGDENPATQFPIMSFECQQALIAK